VEAASRSERMWSWSPVAVWPDLGMCSLRLQFTTTRGARSGVIDAATVVVDRHGGSPPSPCLLMGGPVVTGAFFFKDETCAASCLSGGGSVRQL
jgi:hypothetical protein